MLSIITVNLNDAAGLKRTALSVAAQTSSDYEWIVVDGASTDGSLDVIDKYKACISQWVSEPDDGVYDAMNKGIPMARGDYLLFLNSGDALADNRVVEDFLAFASGEDVIYGDTYAIDTEGRMVGRMTPPDDISLLHFFNHNINHQSTFFHRRCFADGGYDLKYKLCADRALVLSLLCDGRTFRHWHRHVARYDLGGMSTRQTALMTSESRQTLEDIVPSAILRDYDDFVTFRDVDIARMAKRIIRAPRIIRHIGRLCMYPVYWLASLSKY